MKVELLEYDDRYAEVAVGEGDEQVILTFRRTSQGIRRTASTVAKPGASTWVPRTFFMEAYQAALAAILGARRDAKDPCFFRRKLGEH